MLLTLPVKAEQLITANAHWPPWRVLNEQAELSGIEIDILARIASHLKVDLVSKGCG